MGDATPETPLATEPGKEWCDWATDWVLEWENMRPGLVGECGLGRPLIPIVAGLEPVERTLWSWRVLLSMPGVPGTLTELEETGREGERIWLE